MSKLNFRPFVADSFSDFGCIDIKALTFALQNNIDKITAKIYWCYSTSTAVIKDFDFTQDGYDEAIKWLEQMRVEFANQLLE